VAGALPFLFHGRTERFGITHEKFVKVSVFSVYYLPSDPIDASFSSILRLSVVVLLDDLDILRATLWIHC
jgi:hypothetical protein